MYKYMNKKLLTYLYLHSNVIKQKYSSIKKFIDNNNLYGGSNKTEYKVKYKNNDYIFEKHEFEDLYILSSYDKYNNDCVVISVDKTTHVANINELNGNVPNCIKSNNKVGTKLLKVTLAMIKKYKNKLGINVVTLYDTSYKSCGKKHLELIYLGVLTSGDTWYGKYGFRPVTTINNNQIIINDQLNIIYNTNKQIMETKTVSDINLRKYFIGTELENIVTNITKKQPNALLKEVLKYLLLNWNQQCEVMSNIYIQLFNDCGLRVSGTYYGLFLD